MTESFIKECCKKDKLYRTPSVNDKLYLHYKGFRVIENLENYTGLTCLYVAAESVMSVRCACVTLSHLCWQGVG